jgi:hypothetical protein
LDCVGQTHKELDLTRSVDWATLFQKSGTIEK